MLPSVRAFFAGILDYAGLFPPAKLPLDEAIRRYARYRTEAERWMLGRFVCSAGQLPSLLAYGDQLFCAGDPYSFSVVIGTSSGNTEQVLDEWVAARKAMQEFCAQYRGRVRVSIEERANRQVRTGLQQWFFVSQLADDAAEGQPFPFITTYWEGELNDDWRSEVSQVIDLMAKYRLGRRGFKLRCGGLHASTFPSVEQVAHIITACCDAGVPLKFTAGLHHPMRHFDTSVQTTVHGFLNVFGAGVLAHARKLSEEQVREIVADEDAGHFTFAEGGFAWKDVCASVPEITAARQQGVISFGSCSFEEPRDDLRKLGLL